MLAKTLGHALGLQALARKLEVSGPFLEDPSPPTSVTHSQWLYPKVGRSIMFAYTRHLLGLWFPDQIRAAASALVSVQGHVVSSALASFATLLATTDATFACLF